MRGFADHLGLALRTVAKWEQLGADTVPRPDTQAVLDTALARADAASQERFQALLSAVPNVRADVPKPRAAEYETWTEDLDRVVVCLSRQNFAFAQNLLNRWLCRCAPQNVDDRAA
ncbi:hypothetical protein GCM10010470_58480 [Saccharopolyspora taberi]|uniref:Uncharacterized protein n=2 Tax=Saccharopolyspora taberi TaxID=60895 RepID=A0ABN3VKY0_9PSEU